MKSFASATAVAICMVATALPARAGPAAGAVKSASGTIAARHAVAYVVRDARNPRASRVEVLVTDVPVDTATFVGDLDPHLTAINLDVLRNRDYLLLWVAADGAATMNATYSKTMTQYLNDASGGLKAEITRHTATRIEGRVFSPAPLKTMDGPAYTIDVTFAADVVPALSGTALPAGGGEPGTALTALLAAIETKDWNGIKAGLSPNKLPAFDKDYNTPAENLATAVDTLNAWLPTARARVTGGFLVSDSDAVLELEGERFGSRVLALVRMTRTGGAWQYEKSLNAGTLR